MSQSLPTYGPANPGDQDTYGEDCTGELTARGTTIASIGTPAIDPSSLTASLLVISGVTPLAGNLKFAFRASGGVAGVRYTVTFPLTLADGNVINRSVVIPISQYVG